MEETLKEYRNSLATAEQKMQEDYDKTVISLSGGALGISFAFIKDIIRANPIQYKWMLVVCWIAWGFSITMVLASYFLSHLALRKTIEDLDEADKNSTIEEFYSQQAGGKYSYWTARLNFFGGILFFVGVIFIIVFIAYNFGG